MNAIGIDLGGTQIKGVLMSAEGAVVQRRMLPTHDGDKRGWLEGVRRLIAEFGGASPVGISAPGLVAPDGDSIVCMPGRLKGLEGLNWTEHFDLGWHIPVTNDAQAALLGEAWIGAAAGLANAILLTLGTGVGGAILANGQVLRGHLGRAGHFGHTCLDPRGTASIAGMPGALECFIGNYNIQERTGGRFASTHALLGALRLGDTLARECWATSIRALACAIGSFVNVLDPEAVILGGGIAQAGEVLFDPLRAELAKVEWRPLGAGVKLLPAVLGEWAGATGAAWVTLQQLPR
jgi:glucokinase